MLYNRNMKFLKRLIVFLISIVLVVFNLSCGVNYSQINFTCFETGINIVVDKTISKTTETEIKNYLFNLEEQSSVNLSTSLISQYNNLAVNKAPNLSNELKEILGVCKKVYSLTNGGFDPTIFPLVKLWQFNAGTYKNPNFIPPTIEQIVSALSNVGFDKIQDLTYVKSSMVEIDLGGALKGYAAEKVGNMLINKGVKKGYINVGSSSLYIIESNTLGIVHPRNNSSVILTLNQKIKNTAVSTSGDYERFYQYDNERYSHIINAKTGMPANTGVVSATVLGESGAETDAISTALCTYSKQELINFVSLNGDNYKIIAVYLNGQEKQIITNFSSSSFTLHDSSYTFLQV